MKKLITLLLLMLFAISCKKESGDFIWERSFSRGNAFFAVPSADSGLVGTGMMNGKPYLVKLSRDKSVEIEYSYEENGLFSSVWTDKSCFVAGGSSNRKLLITRISAEGVKIWDTTLSATFTIDIASVIHTGNGNFLAVGSADPDSSGSGATGLLFVRFDTTGKILLNKEIPDISFISASGAAVDNSGSIFLAVTRRHTGTKSKASVIKYNSDIQKIWETDLYNNPDVASVCRDVVIGGSDSVYVTGKTEVARTSGTLDNSYIASLGKSGAVGRKKFLENSNSGCSIVYDGKGRIMILNRNCFFVSLIDPLNGYNAERLRMFSACDAYNTDAFGSHIDLNYEGNILVGGSRGGNFYLALKSSSQ
jgi:hypothetical protein